MRHLMKGISLILAVSLFVTCFVFASEGEAVDYSGYIKLHNILSSLDVLKEEDSFATEYTRDITEDEFNKMLSNLIGITYTKNSPGEFCFNRAVQKVVDLMGYDLKVKTVGPYPTGYISVATSLGILDGLKAKGSKQLSVGDAMQLLYNSLNVELLIQTIYGDNDAYEIVENETLLSVHKKVHFIKGVVTDNSITDFFGESALSDGWLKIDDVKYKIDGNTDADLLGKKVGVYYKTDENKVRNILYIEDITALSDCLRVEAKNIADCKDLVFTHYNGDKINTINIKPSVMIIYNNIATRYEDAIFKPDNGYVDFIDNNSDGNYDVIIIKAYVNMIIRAINPTELEIKDIVDNGKNISFKDIEDRYLIKTTSGERVDFDYFKEYDVVSVAKAKNDVFYECIVSNKFAAGDVKAVYFSGTDKSVKFDDRIYPIDKGYTAAQQEIEAGMYGTALLDFEGDIVFFVDESGNTRYGYVIAGGEEPEVFNDNKLLLKLLTQDNKIEVYECNKNVVIDGSRISGITNVKNMLFNAGKAKQQLVKYQLNKDGKINVVDTAMDLTLDSPLFTTNEPADKNHLRVFAKSKNGIYLSAASSIAAGVMLTSKTRIFCVGPANSTDDSNFKVIATSSLSSGANQATYDVYTSDSECMSAEVLVTRTDLSRKTSSVPYLIKDMGQTLDSDGEVVNVIYAIQDNKDIEIMVNNDFKNSINPLAGDLARITLGPDGKAQAYSVIYRKGNAFAESGTFNSAFYSVTGKIYNYSQGILQITKLADSNLSKTKIPADSLYFKDSAPIYLWDSTIGEIEKVTTADIKDYRDDNAADTVALVLRNGTPIVMIIYR